MTTFGGAAVKLPCGKGLATIAPGDFRGRNPKMEPVSLVRIKGYWVHETNVQARARSCRFRRLAIATARARRVAGFEAGPPGGSSAVRVVRCDSEWRAAVVVDA